MMVPLDSTTSDSKAHAAPPALPVRTAPITTAQDSDSSDSERVGCRSRTYQRYAQEAAATLAAAPSNALADLQLAQASMMVPLDSTTSDSEAPRMYAARPAAVPMQA